MGWHGTGVMLACLDAVKDVFALRSGEGNQVLTASVGKDSALALDGDLHACHRRILLRSLKLERMRSFFDPMQKIALQTIHGEPDGQIPSMSETCC